MLPALNPATQVQDEFVGLDASRAVDSLVPIALPQVLEANHFDMGVGKGRAIDRLDYMRFSVVIAAIPRFGVFKYIFTASVRPRTCNFS